MKKKILIFGALALVLVIFGILLSSKESQQEPINQQVSEDGKSLVRVELPISEYIKKETQLEDKVFFENKNTNDVVEFRLLKDPAYKARNQSFQLTVNQEEASGIAGGKAVYQADFSPNNNYFVFSTRSSCGAGCNAYSLNLLDIKNLKLSAILPPRKITEFNGDTSEYLDRRVEPYIDSFSFENDKLKIISFFIATDKSDGKVYRVSLREVWSYDLSSGQYTFVGTIPE